MGLDSQTPLLEMPDQPEATTRKVTAAPRLRTANRDQSMYALIWVDELIGPDHPARAIWELTGRLDLSRFAEPLKSRQGGAGRPAWDPQ